MTDDLSLLDLIDDRGADRAYLLSPGDRQPAPTGVEGVACSAERLPAPRSIETARSERDDAMARVEDHAPEGWNDYARAWLRDYLTTHAELFPDDVWAAGLREPSEARAFGPVVKYAATRGWIVRTGEMRQRTRGHATPAFVWRSLIYRKESA